MKQHRKRKKEKLKNSETWSLETKTWSLETKTWSLETKKWSLKIETIF